MYLHREIIAAFVIIDMFGTIVSVMHCRQSQSSSSLSLSSSLSNEGLWTEGLLSKAHLISPSTFLWPLSSWRAFVLLLRGDGQRFHSAIRKKVEAEFNYTWRQLKDHFTRWRWCSYLVFLNTPFLALCFLFVTLPSDELLQLSAIGRSVCPLHNPQEGAGGYE